MCQRVTYFSREDCRICIKGVISYVKTIGYVYKRGIVVFKNQRYVSKCEITYNTSPCLWQVGIHPPGHCWLTAFQLSVTGSYISSATDQQEQSCLSQQWVQTAVAIGNLKRRDCPIQQLKQSAVSAVKTWRNNSSRCLSGCHTPFRLYCKTRDRLSRRLGISMN